MEYHTICITNCKLNPPINANHKRKCEINRFSAYHIPPKGVNGWNPSSYFFYQHLTPDGVMGVFLPSLWKFRPMDNIPTIMHYEFRIVHDTHVRASLREGWIHQMHGFSQQLRIMHYAL